MRDALDFFGDGPSISSSNETDSVAKAAKRRQRKRKRDTEVLSSDESDSDEAGKMNVSESEELSDGEDLEVEEEEEEEEHGGSDDEKTLQLFAGHTPQEWRKKKSENRTKRRKKRKLDKEKKEILRRQEVSATFNLNAQYYSWACELCHRQMHFVMLIASMWLVLMFLMLWVALSSSLCPTLFLATSSKMLRSWATFHLPQSRCRPYL